MKLLSDSCAMFYLMSKINKQSWFLLHFLISLYNVHLHPTGIYLFIMYIYIYFVGCLFIYMSPFVYFIPISII